MSASQPTYTFVSVSTAKPGRLEDLLELARKPNEAMEGKVPGLVGRQVGIDRARNAVVVWSTFDRKESLYDYLETEHGRASHGDGSQMGEIIETFTMYDLTPVSQRL